MHGTRSWRHAPLPINLPPIELISILDTHRVTQSLLCVPESSAARESFLHWRGQDSCQLIGVPAISFPLPPPLAIIRCIPGRNAYSCENAAVESKIRACYANGRAQSRGKYLARSGGYSHGNLTNAMLMLYCTDCERFCRFVYARFDWIFWILIALLVSFILFVCYYYFIGIDLVNRKKAMKKITVNIIFVFVFDDSNNKIFYWKKLIFIACRDFI